MSRGSGKPVQERTHSVQDPPLPDQLSRFGSSALGCCCALALRASQLAGGRPCRVDLRGQPPPEDDADGWPIPVRGRAGSEEVEAWISWERGETEWSSDVPPGLDELAAWAGVALERHRLALEARRARRAAEQARSALGHELRGHLHTAVLRAENLVLDLRGGDLDVAEVTRGIEALKDFMERMAREIESIVGDPDAGGEPAGRAGTAADRAVSIPDLLREEELATAAGEERAPEVVVAGDVPPVRVDPDRLAGALEELFRLAGAARETPTVEVNRGDEASSVHIVLLADLGPPPGSGPGGNAPGTDGDRDRPSLWEVVRDLRGELRVRAEEGTRVEVDVILPAAGREG